MTIKKTLKLVSVAAIAFAGISSASAIQIKMGTFDAGAGANYRANPIGQFESVLDNYALGKSTDGTWFGTFCIERNEYFNTTDTYDVEINNGSIRGGYGGAANGKDIISVGTAWLYEQFAKGTLAGFDYGNRKHAKQLQNTIWGLEDEFRNLNWLINNKPHKFGTFLGLAMNSLNLDLSSLQQNYTGSNVQVMNLTRNGENSHHQDQLIYTKVPDSGTTASILGLGLFALIAAKRRFKK